MSARVTRVFVSVWAVLALSLLSVPVLAQTWTFTGNMNNPRYGALTTLLDDGRVLVAGGGDSSGEISSAEIYDPVTSAWTLAPNMLTTHGGGVSVRLNDGRVLICGGYGGPTKLCEIYDPGANTWTSTGSMNAVRTNFAGVLLPTGKVLVMGGDQGCYCFLNSAELYDPSIGVWTYTGSLPVAVNFMQATLLSTGKVLAAGGYNLGAVANAELYDPGTGTWSPTGPLNLGREFFSQILLGNGKVLVYGGRIPDCSAITNTAEIYDSLSGIWTVTGSTSTAIDSSQLVLLDSGQALRTGGLGSSCSGATLNTTNTYDPSSGTWSAATNMNQARYAHSAVTLADGRVLVAGGLNGSTPLGSAEILAQSVDSEFSALTANVSNLSDTPPGIRTSLLAKAAAAQDSFNNGDLRTAQNQLNALIHALNAQSGKQLIGSEATLLINEASNIIAALNQ